MLATCFGIYLLIALFTFLIFYGYFIDAQHGNDEEIKERA
jgi:hypothetical protein